MNLQSILNQQVFNHFYGEGTIISVKLPNQLTIKFKNKTTNYNFESFYNNTLSFTNPTLQNQITIQSQKYNQQKQLENQLETDHYTRLRKLTFNLNQFDQNYHTEYLDPNQIFNSKTVKEINNLNNIPHNIRKTNNSIILISEIKLDKNSNKFTYQDYFTESGKYIFTTHQTKNLNKQENFKTLTTTKLKKVNKNNLNKTEQLLNSIIDNTPIQLYIKFPSGEYYYQGQVVFEQLEIEKSLTPNKKLYTTYNFTFSKVATTNTYNLNTSTFEEVA